jgi:hypothetical protein
MEPGRLQLQKVLPSTYGASAKCLSLCDKIGPSNTKEPISDGVYSLTKKSEWWNNKACPSKYLIKQKMKILHIKTCEMEAEQHFLRRKYTISKYIY